ncbi:DUF305 domain-containing protein [Rhodococcus opacus]|uniref:DUF305 domain-containing protein n=1 Tax=Rhodococcus opacus TaxID=37919 RepID=A0A076F663_RHOOP|nr:DUF305 domain-containing protein [Rhodococcus opacus]AII11189.1 hypothetical protein EP51_44910 [Rhodococcus opacus]
MWSKRSTPIKLALTVGAATGILVIAGCSDNSGGGHDMSQMSNTTTTAAAAAASGAAQTSVAFNEADVMFLQMMYPHHAQAVEMADMVEGRTTNPQVLELAGAVTSAQGPEMEQITSLLAQWGKPAPAADGGSMDGMDHGGGGTSGMMTAEQMTELAGKSGADFDTAWLTMMVEHHSGAIEMAQTELADGRNADAKQLATDVIGAQQAEITTMNALLQQN